MNVDKMIALGKQSSAIRELFEYGNARKKEIGEDKVFDFSIGNPNIPCPKVVTEKLIEILSNDCYDKLTTNTKTFSIKINKKSLICDDYTLVLNDDEFIYDGNAHSLLLSGTLPSVVTARCEGNNQKDEMELFLEEKEGNGKKTDS